MTQADGKFLEQVVYLPYRWAVGPVFSKFFEEFKKKKIMGTRCQKCNRVLVPARMFCPRCFVETKDWIEVSDKGIIKTWALITFKYSGQPKDPPYITGLVDLDGADVGFLHFIGGTDLSDIESVKRKIKIGGRVKARWREKPQGNILDIEYFEPI